MKAVILNFSFLVMSQFLVSPVFAANIQLTGKGAESFIEHHFPDAEIPGQFEGFFSYKTKSGTEKDGYAKCSYPAMGARSDGAVITCLVKYSPVYLTGEAAESFIERHLPAAEIPGPVEGAFTYQNARGARKTGVAKCFYPAMGARSNGAVTSCSVVY